MGRPTSLLSATVHLKAETYHAVQALAVQRTTSRASVLRQAVEEFMRRQHVPGPSAELSRAPQSLVPVTVNSAVATEAVTSPILDRSANGDYIRCGLCPVSALPILRAELPGHVAAHRAAFEAELAASTKR